MNVLEIRNLNKEFASVKALNNVSFDVEEGSICGLLGPNGAGKTTLLRIINGILTSDSGTVHILGKEASLKASDNIGYMPEERGLYDKMRVEDQILYFGQLKGGNRKRLREVMNEYLEIFNLSDDRRRLVKELSKGNQQKVQIISTLVHEPKLVILDEPFSGFDPINGAILQQLIGRLHEKGTTIMLSSHNMPAIEEMCSDIALINHGNLLVKDKIENIKEQHKDDSIIFTTPSPISLDTLTQANIITEGHEERPMNWRKGYAYRVRKAPGVSNSNLLDSISYQSDILHFEETLPSLNEIFIKYTTKKDEPTESDNKE